MYVAGAPENERDFLLSRIADPRARQSLVVPLDRPAGAATLSGRFDLVLGSGLQGREGGVPAAYRLARLGL
jgi:hypothetical protein